MNLYDELKQNPKIIDIYNNVDNEDNYKLIATHSWKHINKVIYTVEKILTDLHCDVSTIEYGKIAALLHDLGCINGKENHALRSYEMAKEILKDKNIDNLNKEIILNAILHHSNVKENDTIIGKTLALADKIDFDKDRMLPLGLEEPHYNQMNNIEKVIISIKDIVLIKFIVNDNFDKLDLEKYYFTQKIFDCIKEFSNFISKDYEVKLVNGDKETNWNY